MAEEQVRTSALESGQEPSCESEDRNCVGRKRVFTQSHRDTEKAPLFFASLLCGSVTLWLYFCLGRVSHCCGIKLAGRGISRSGLRTPNLDSSGYRRKLFHYQLLVICPNPRGVATLVPFRIYSWPKQRGVSEGGKRWHHNEAYFMYRRVVAAGDNPDGLAQLQLR